MVLVVEGSLSSADASPVCGGSSGPASGGELRERGIYRGATPGAILRLCINMYKDKYKYKNIYIYIYLRYAILLQGPWELPSGNWSTEWCQPVPG